MKIKNILEATNGKLIIGDLEKDCKKFSKDTRIIQNGDAYIGIKGENFDGNTLWEEALQKGAETVIVQGINFRDDDLEHYSELHNIIELNDSNLSNGNVTIENSYWVPELVGALEDNELPTPKTVEEMLTQDTFDAFLSSEKSINSNLITTVHGNKGKGRFSFLGFANNCKWKTTYKNENKKYTFSIEINGQTPNKYYPSEKEEISTNNTGTKVTIYNVNNLMEEQMKSRELKNSLLESFSWYLYLKKNENKHCYFKVYKKLNSIKKVVEISCYILLWSATSQSFTYTD